MLNNNAGPAPAQPQPHLAVKHQHSCASAAAAEETKADRRASHELAPGAEKKQLMSGRLGDETRVSDISRSRYRQIHIHPSAVPRQQSTESAYVGGSKSYSLAQNASGVQAMMTRSAGKSSGSACRKTATYQNQQHLQLQSKYKLFSKVPDFKGQPLVTKDSAVLSAGGSAHGRADGPRNEERKEARQGPASTMLFSQLLANQRDTNEATGGSQLAAEGASGKGRGAMADASGPSDDLQMHLAPRDLSERELGGTVHRLSSPIRRNRPRITNEVQSQDKDIAQYLQQIYIRNSGNEQQPGPILDENVPSKNVNRMHLGVQALAASPGQTAGPGGFAQAASLPLPQPASESDHAAQS